MAKTISESFRREARAKVVEITKKAIPVNLFRAYGSYNSRIFAPNKSKHIIGRLGENGL